MLYAVLIIIAIIAASLFARLVVLNRELRRLASALKETPRNFHTITGNAAFEELCDNVNSHLNERKSEIIALQKRENNLREAIANISHDLRTPLSAIIGYLQLQKSNPDKSAEYTEIIENRIGVLRDLVESFYELSVADCDNLVLTLEKIDMTSVLTNCLLGARTSFVEKGIEPEIAIPEDEPVYVIGNALALERVCQNLTSNALKYADGKVSVRLFAERDSCALSFSNNTDLPDVSRVFDRFYTADKKRSNGSSGIGLYLVKVLVEKMNGSVYAFVEDGRFTVEVRLKSI